MISCDIYEIRGFVNSSVLLQRQGIGRTNLGQVQLGALRQKLRLQYTYHIAAEEAVLLTVRERGEEHRLPDGVGVCAVAARTEKQLIRVILRERLTAEDLTFPCKAQS